MLTLTELPPITADSGTSMYTCSIANVNICKQLLLLHTEILYYHFMVCLFEHIAWVGWRHHSSVRECHLHFWDGCSGNDHRNWRHNKSAKGSVRESSGKCGHCSITQKINLPNPCWSGYRQSRVQWKFSEMSTCCTVFHLFISSTCLCVIVCVVLWVPLLAILLIFHFYVVAWLFTSDAMALLNVLKWCWI